MYRAIRDGDFSPSHHRHKDDFKSTRHYSSKQESYVAKKFNGTQQKNSGATPFQKGDVVLDKWLLECKTKTKSSDSISIKKDWIVKNNEEALFMGKPYNAVVFSFGPYESNYYIIDENLFNELVNKVG